ncbi:MAG: sigma-70 family RNA polymerase sigma factor [Myxococcaceae bacterium]|nr:sigma-70 family RNA polymerase sigma factor [Myxococcaceae bacterium]MCA3011010.1 sigma-70 family RNA polymerase sigma factor [Myxococcaceae bacterium]
MLSDDDLFADVSRRKAEGRDFQKPLGELVFRWRDASTTVVRRVQGAFMRGSPDDVDEIFQDAAAKFMSRGLDQFRGVSELVPGKAASPRTFFLRIVKHCAIDRYRRQREELDEGPREGEDEREESVAEGNRAVAHARAAAEAREADEEYWAAFRRLEVEHPNEAAAWELYHHQDLDDHEEVARRLGITVVNSYKRVSRAQAWLKAYVLEARQEEGQ